jgi:hypothetical protein
MFLIDYRDLSSERQRRRSNLRAQVQRRLATTRPDAERQPRRLLAPVGRVLVSVGERLTADPAPEQARSR